MKLTKIQNIAKHPKIKGPTRIKVELSAFVTSSDVIESRIFLKNLKKLTFKSLKSIILSY